MSILGKRYPEQIIAQSATVIEKTTTEINWKLIEVTQLLKNVTQNSRDSIFLNQLLALLGEKFLNYSTNKSKLTKKQCVEFMDTFMCDTEIVINSYRTEQNPVSSFQKSSTVTTPVIVNVETNNEIIDVVISEPDENSEKRVEKAHTPETSLVINMEADCTATTTTKTDNPIRKELITKSVTGVVKSFSSKKKYGFIRAGDNKADIFFHISSLKVKPSKIHENFIFNFDLYKLVDGTDRYEALNINDGRVKTPKYSTSKFTTSKSTNSTKSIQKQPTHAAKKSGHTTKLIPRTYASVISNKPISQKIKPIQPRRKTIQAKKSRQQQPKDQLLNSQPSTTQFFREFFEVLSNFQLVKKAKSKSKGKFTKSY